MNICTLLKSGNFQNALEFIRKNCGKSEVHRLTKTSDIMKLAKVLSKELNLSECKKPLIDFWKFSVKDERELVFAVKSKREVRLLIIGILSENINHGRIKEIFEMLKEVAPLVFDWETCDQLASKVLSKLLRSKEVYRLFNSWIDHPNVWTRRLPISTIPPALKSCQECVSDLLPYLEKISDSKEKPLRKAYSWAKNELSKFGIDITL